MNEENKYHVLFIKIFLYLGVWNLRTTVCSSLLYLLTVYDCIYVNPFLFELGYPGIRVRSDVFVTLKIIEDTVERESKIMGEPKTQFEFVRHRRQSCRVGCQKYYSLALM